MKNSKTFQGYLLPKICETTVAGLNTMEKNHLLMTVKPLRKPKRFRSAFTTEQISFLEQQFKKFPYISCEHRKEIASTLNLKERAIKIWFQNRRMKEKKDSVNKEIDYEITQKADGQDRLINVCALPSANEQHSYSLPVIAKAIVDNCTAAVPNANTDKKPSHPQAPHILSMKDTKSPLAPNLISHTKKQTPQIRNVMRSNPPLTGNLKHKSSIESDYFTSKKFKKQVDPYIHCNTKQNVHKNLGAVQNSAAEMKATPEDLTIKKKSNVSQSMKSQKPAEMSVPCYPVMPSVYAHPYISSGGMIWKPISIMPVMSASTAIPGNLQHLGTDSRKPCSCNCHGNAQTFTMPSTTINPYSQYMMSVPFSGPKF